MEKEKEIKKEPVTERRDRWHYKITPHNIIVLISIFLLRYDRDKSRSGSPKRKEYSREEKRNGKKKERR